LVSPYSCKTWYIQRLTDNVHSLWLLPLDLEHHSQLLDRHTLGRYLLHNNLFTFLRYQLTSPYYRRLAKEDALKITIPHIVLASKDEPIDIIADYKEIIESNGKGGFVETYGSMHHGWMGARANLEDTANLKEYERG
jgi:hypothetical protein